MSTTPSWNLRMVKAAAAYKKLRGLTQNGRVDWRGIEICHVDTGVRRHPTLGPWTKGKSRTVLLEDGINLQEPEELPLDPMNYSVEEDELEVQPGHGTRTASVICGYQRGKYRGVAPGVPLIPYRVTNGSVLNKRRAVGVSSALEHAMETNACEVASICLGTPFGPEPLGRVIDRAYERGIIVVAAGGQVIDKVVYPAKYFRCIGVGGVKKNRRIWFRYDPIQTKFIDVWAPAADVPRANSCPIPDTQDQFEHEVGTGEGTSYACCHVAAAAAMWLAFRGEEIDDAYEHPWQRIEAFRQIVRTTGSSINDGRMPRNGTGILDINALLKEPLPIAASLKKERLAVNMRF